MYLDQFCLGESPFRQRPDPRFYCEEAGHRGVISTLRAALDRGERVIKIVGEAGTGKTALAQRLAAELGPRDSVLIDRASSGAELLRAVVEEIAPPPPAAALATFMPEPVAGLVAALLDPVLETSGGRDRNPERLLARARRHICALARAGRRVVLLVDDAGSLDYNGLAALRDILAIEPPRGVGAQVVLFGGRDLDQLLSDPRAPGLGHRVAFSYRLRAMDRDETASYVAHRLAVAGAPANPFASTAIDEIAQLTGGVPARVNQLCHLALTRACSTACDAIDGPLVRNAAGLGRSRLSEPVRPAAKAMQLAPRSNEAPDPPSDDAPEETVVPAPERRRAWGLVQAAAVGVPVAAFTAALILWGLPLAQRATRTAGSAEWEIAPSLDYASRVPGMEEEQILSEAIASLEIDRAAGPPSMAVSSRPPHEPPVAAPSPAPEPARARFAKNQLPNEPGRRAEREYRHALELLARGNTAAADAALGQVLELDPFHHPAREARTALFLRLDRLNDAARAIETGLALAPKHPPFAMMKARLLARGGRIGEAIETLEHSVPDVESQPDYHALMAALHERNGDHETAADLYRNVLTVRPENAVWWMGLGIALERRADTPGALSAYRAASILGDLGADSQRFVDERIAALADGGS